MYHYCTGEYMIIKHEEIEPIEFDKLKIIDYTAGQDNSSSFAEITVPMGVSHKISWSNGDGPKKLDSMISSGSAKFERI
jgi:hypothetical protein